jgi:hypothetical protein
MATNGYKRLHGLTEEQKSALDLVLLGKTDGEVAGTVGVHRTTVAKWKLFDPWFRTELNRRRLAIWAGSADRLRGLLPKALDVLDREMNDPGKAAVTAALGVVKLAGLAGVPGRELAGAPTDAEAVIAEKVKARVAEKKAEREKYEGATAAVARMMNGSSKEEDEADRREAREEVLAEIERKLNDGETS